MESQKIAPILVLAVGVGKLVAAARRCEKHEGVSAKTKPEVSVKIAKEKVQGLLQQRRRVA